ncbi:FecR family protein [Pseudotenacibaculum haliotis]|uniref:FecR family protein n=1 Tax=Pseudotenacibaculum haliotis TaxID=1862138 RepID=A0ABW5LRM9_9FLAO
MEQHYDDTFLARWLANELTAEELSGFKNSEEYEKYAQIVEMLDTAEIANFDVESNLQATLEKLNSKAETKKRRVLPLWSYAAAASVALIFFMYSFFFTTTTYTTQLAEKIEFDLPDGSHVDLNAGSSLSFKKGDWKDERSLELDGEAFFKVEKGSTFTVNTDEGKVTVLGTQFVVNSREDFYNVICYEGKVKVITENNESVILTKGKAFAINKSVKKEYNVEALEPSWVKGASTFKSTSIELVLKELERQFNITINEKENVKPGLFTGSFSHKDVKLAVKTVFTAMEISYKMDADGNVVIQKP